MQAVGNTDFLRKVVDHFEGFKGIRFPCLPRVEDFRAQPNAEG